jgi:phosphoribosylanthranilate isomerase
MKKFLVKICGITRPEDALFAANAGADAIGLNFWRGSKRFVDDDRAREILAALPRGIVTVGVFVNAHPLVVTETLADLRLDRIQLHGDEKVGDFGDIDPARVIRALRVQDEAALKEGLAWDVGLFICDAYAESYGGSGQVANWPLIAEHARRPFLLAGGLGPDNVAAGIEATRPDGVDVSSGVESAPGLKDRAKVESVLKNARAAAARLGLG